MTFVPKMFAGETIVCLGTGPSLTQVDVDVVRGRARVIAVNDAYRLAPWADVLYACDAKWWKWQSRERKSEIDAFSGLKFCMQPQHYVEGVIRLKNAGEQGLEHEPTGLRTGRNSGYQAINLALHLGAKRIVLLGYDMTYGKADRTHFFGSHPDRTKPIFSVCLRNFPTLVKPLSDLGIDVVNATRHTALKCFKRVPLEQALGIEVAA